MCTIHDDQAVERFRRQWRLDPYHLRRMRFAFLQAYAPWPDALQELPATVREPFRREFEFHCLTLVDRYDSTKDGASKLLFQTRDGRRLETVILRSGQGRTSLCVSSQIGCAAGCRFCATGYLKNVRNLQVGEVLDQVVQAAQLLTPERRRIRNVVFMGMGEPLNNEQALHAAVTALQHRHGFQLSAKRILVSTVGVPQAMMRWAAAFPRAPIALSLHSADQAFRESLIPLARRYPLSELQAALRDVTTRQAGPVMIEYLMLRDRNDRLRDAAALADYLQGIPAHVNLIPFNAIAEAPELQTTERPQRERFGALLRSRGLTVTIRYSQGADIAAACGQLAANS